MRRFVKNVFYFLAPFIILSIPLDLYISNVLKDKSHYAGEYEVWNDIMKGSIDAEIAVYGSSRAWVHFNPEIFEKMLHQKTYNFGIDGHNFWLQYLRHKEYFKYNTTPKLIIYSVDIYTLAKRKDLYNLNQFLPYMLWKSDIYESTKSYEGFETSDYIIPLKRYINNIKFSELTESTTKMRQNGFMGNDKEWNIDLKGSKLSNPNYSVEIDSASIVLFNSFIKEIKQKDIEVIFVYTPEFIEGQSFVQNRNEIFSVFEEISKNHNVPFYDYTNNDISYDRSLFYNSLHLNAPGADIFTERFINDYKKFKHGTQLMLDAGLNKQSQK